MLNNNFSPCCELLDFTWKCYFTLPSQPFTTLLWRSLGCFLENLNTNERVFTKSLTKVFKKYRWLPCSYSPPCHSCQEIEDSYVFKFVFFVLYSCFNIFCSGAVHIFFLIVIKRSSHPCHYFFQLTPSSFFHSFYLPSNNIILLFHKKENYCYQVKSRSSSLFGSLQTLYIFFLNPCSLSPV